MGASSSSAIDVLSSVVPVVVVVVMSDCEVLDVDVLLL